MLLYGKGREKKHKWRERELGRNFLFVVAVMRLRDGAEERLSADTKGALHTYKGKHVFYIRAEFTLAFRQPRGARAILLIARCE